MNRIFGSLGESTAADWLRKRGWRILARNYAVRGGEIDIAAFRLGTLLCAEVKTRSQTDYGLPRDAVDGIKIRRFREAVRDLTENYVINGRIPVNFGKFTIKRRVFRIRCDIIEVYAARNGNVSEIIQIKDAF